METVLLDHPWIALCLLFGGGWLITFLYARPRSSPSTQDGSPAVPTAAGQARPEAKE
jgi:hypothetical protein